MSMLYYILCTVNLYLEQRGLHHLGQQQLLQPPHGVVVLQAVNC